MWGLDLVLDLALAKESEPGSGLVLEQESGSVRGLDLESAQGRDRRWIGR